MATLQSVGFTGEHITLAQFLKKVDAVFSGGEVKDFLHSRIVLINGEREERRGRKLYRGDQVSVNGQTYVLE